MPGTPLTQTRHEATGLPASAVLSLWLGGVLRGSVSPDELLDRLAEASPVHVLHGLATEPVPPLRALGDLRRRGASGCSLALPVAGDPAGLAGPPPFNAAAMEAGEAVLVTGVDIGLVPERVGAALEWDAQDARRPPPPDAAEAGRTLRQALLEATNLLVDLDVARWRPEVADTLTNVRHRPRVAVPPDLPEGYGETIDRALLCREVVALALADEGGAVSAYETRRRREALLPLARAARHALVAACSW